MKMPPAPVNVWSVAFLTAGGERRTEHNAPGAYIGPVGGRAAPSPRTHCFLDGLL